MALAEEKSSVCASCQSKDGRYRCPECNRRSCCVECVKRHKENFGCTGKRSVTKFIPLSQYNDSTLLDDYFFLEDISRFSDSISRDKIKAASYQGWRQMKNMSRLKSVAHNKGVNVCLAPAGLSAHKVNTSRVNFVPHKKQQTILWRIQWCFKDCGLKFVDKCVSEQRILQDLIDKYIHPVKSDPVIRHRLRQYVLHYNDVKVYMREEKCQEKRYHLLDKEISLLDNLRGKLIIEHPILWVSYSEDTSQFPLITDTTPLDSTPLDEITPLTETTSNSEWASSSNYKEVSCSTNYEMMSSSGNYNGVSPEVSRSTNYEGASTSYGLQLITRMYV